MFRRVLAVTVLAGLLGAPCPLLAIGWACVGPARPFRELVADSGLVIYGVVDKVGVGPNGDSMECLISGVLKAHPTLRGKKMLTIPGLVEIKDRNRPPQLLIFCDVNMGKVVATWSVPAGSAVVDYLKGLLAINPRNPVARLRYCFDFLDHPEEEIAGDAHTEFSNASESEISLVAPKLPAAKLRRWLRDAKKSPSHQGLYAKLLGHCGTADDAALLRSLTERYMKEEAPGMAEALTGYILLKPKDGWLYLRRVISNPAIGFLQRYAALRAIRYLHDNRPDVIDKQSIIEAMKLGLDQPDLADIVIDELRKWQCWDLTGRILPLYGKPSHDSPVMRRAILRYATDCPRPEAVAFVAKHRKTDEGKKTFIQ